MSIFDDIKGKAEELLGSHGDQVKDGIEKAGDLIDEKTGGKFADQVDGVQKAASDYVDGQQQA
ncbi:antitoxin [Arthrobacter psychrolactophilus]